MKYNIILQICILFTIISCNQTSKKLVVESVKKDEPLVEKKKVKKSGTSSLQTTSGVNVATGSGLNIS